MTSNDIILLDQFLDQRSSEVGGGYTNSEFFEIFSAEQALKDDDLSYEEIIEGIVDGGGDGGIDSIFIFINDTLYNEEIDLNGIKRNPKVRVAIIQSKTTTGFSETGIDKLIASSQDLFDLSKDIASLRSVYNEQLIDIISKFREAHRNLSSKFPTISFEYFYSSKAVEVNPNVERKVLQLKESIERLYRPLEFNFRFLTATKLLELARRLPTRTLKLKLAENPISTGQEGFVCLVAIKDFLPFITDEDGHIRAYLFEGNVRDYQGKTEVNQEIHQTLQVATDEDFWWLNNGVSIICTNASLSGKILTIEDPEIVNGLQTSREIYNVLHGRDNEREIRHILVRVLKPQSLESRDRIIKATNSQTPIPAASLRATDKIHRDIEDYLYRLGYFYDRRKNFYKNIGKPIKNIFSIPFVAQSVMSCALLEPSNARARPSSLIKNNETYNRIFNNNYPIELFYKCPMIVRRVDDYLRRIGNENFKLHSNNLKFYVAMCVVLTICASNTPRFERIASIELEDISDEILSQKSNIVFDLYKELGGNDQVAKGRDLIQKLLDMHRQQFIRNSSLT